MPEHRRKYNSLTLVDFMGIYHHSQQYVSYIVVVSFIWENATGVLEKNTDLVKSCIVYTSSLEEIKLVNFLWC